MHPNTATMLEMFEAEQRSRGMTDTTVNGRLGCLRTFADGRDILTLTTHDIRLYLGRKGLKPSTRRVYHAAVTAFYTFTHTEGLRLDNPTATIPAPRVPRTKPRPFTAEQIERMLTSGIYWRRRVMILVGYHQGFRRSQIARVHGHDISIDDMTIQTVGKGGKEATLPLHPVVAQLAALMPADDWWFPSIGGRTGHVTAGNVSDAVADAKAAAGILDPRLTAHSLRHSFGTELVEAGVDIRIIQDLMMHEDLSTTQIYTGVSEQRKASAIHRLPSIEIPRHSMRRAA